MRSNIPYFARFLAFETWSEVGAATAAKTSPGTTAIEIDTRLDSKEFLVKLMAIETIKSTPSGVPPRAILQVEPEPFRKNYNRRPFMFEHRVNKHPLMQPEALRELAHRLPPDPARHPRAKPGSS